MAKFKRRSFKRRSGRYSKKQNQKKMMGGNSAIDKVLSAAGNSGMPYIAPIAKTLKLIKGLINVETKYVDNTASPSVDNTGVVYLLNGVAEGNDYNQRNGSSVLNQSISINLAGVVNVTAVSTFLRVLVICDKKPDVGTPTNAGVFTSLYGMIDKENEGDRFVILKNEMINMDTYANPTFTRKYQIDLKGTHSRYDATTAAGTDLEQNAYYLLLLSDQPTNKPSVTYYSRFRFTDN